MQTFDILPRAIHTPPEHSSEANFAPQKSPQQSEQFGDVMDRTLNGAANESPADDSAQDTEGPNHQKTGAQTTAPHHGKPAEKPRKSHHAVKSQQATTQGTPSQPLVVNACAVHLSQVVTIENPPASKGNSENAPAEGGKKAQTAGQVSGTTDSADKTILPQFLASAGAIALPALPSGPKGSASKSAGGQPGQVAALPTKTETPDSAPSQPNAVEPKSVDLKIGDAKTADSKGPDTKMQDLKAPDAKIPELKTSGAKDSPDPSNPAAKEALPLDSAATSADPQSDKAVQIDTAQIPAASANDPKITKSGRPEAAPGSLLVSAPGTGGTSTAKQDVTMKNAEKTPKVAGQAEQELPGNAALKSEELPTGQKSSIQALSHGNAKVDLTATADSRATSALSTTAETSAPAAASTVVPPAAPSDARLRVLERTHDIVALHAMRLAESGSNSLHVVVKPGAGVQLSLELRQNAGGIDVHASLHKGDFEHLSHYWPELQQRLEARGVRVGALTTSENFSSNSHQNFQQSKQQQSSSQDSLHAGAFAEFALAGSMTEAPATRAARATAYRGWETWA